MASFTLLGLVFVLSVATTVGFVWAYNAFLPHLPIPSDSVHKTYWVLLPVAFVLSMVTFYILPQPRSLVYWLLDATPVPSESFAEVVTVTPPPTDTPGLTVFVTLPPPTNTPIPTPLPVSTNTPPPRFTSTPVRTRTAVTISPTVITPTATPAFVNCLFQHPIALEPLNEALIIGREVTFRWRFDSNCTIPSGYGFEIRVWHNGSEPQGAMDAKNQQGEIQFDENGVFSMTINDISKAPGVNGRPGRLGWYVGIVQLEPYQTTNANSTTHIFNIGF